MSKNTIWVNCPHCGESFEQGKHTCRLKAVIDDFLAWVDLPADGSVRKAFTDILKKHGVQSE